MQIKKKKSLLCSLNPANGEGATGSGGGASLGAGSIQPGMAPQACPGAWRSAPPPLSATPLPRNRRRRGSLTERVNGSASQGHLRGAAGRRAEPQLRRSRRRGSKSPDKARDGEAERRLMASPTRRAPPAPLRPPARPPRRSAAPLRALARQSRLGAAAASRATRASPGPSASSGRLSLTPSLPPRWGLHENKKKKRKGKMLFFFSFGRAGVLRLSGLFAPSSHSPAEPPGGLGVGARGWSRRARVES